MNDLPQNDARRLLETSLRLRCVAHTSRARSALLLETFAHVHRSARSRAIATAELRVESEQTRRERDQFRSLAESLQTLTFAIAHDLRQPLFGALMALEHTQATDATPRVQSALDVARAGTREALGRMDGLLRMAQISEAPLNVTTFDLYADIERRRELWDRTFLDRPFHLRRTEPLWVTADRPLLEMAVDNLVENAIRHGPLDRAVEIEVGVTVKNGRPRWYVQDNGPGLPAFVAQHLGVPFRSTGQNAGSGLGLAIVARIIARHGGRFWLRPSPGGGVTFYFTLGEIAHQPPVVP